MVEDAHVERDTDELSEPLVREELGLVLNSPSFANAGRVRSFLEYIVEESLAGRTHLIAGKTIAQDVYGRSPDGDNSSIVRVDARRLRRKLAEYYDSDGAKDPIRIHVDNGGYAPRFEAMAVTAPQAVMSSARVMKPAAVLRGKLPWLFIGSSVLALGLVFWISKPSDRLPRPVEPTVALADNSQLERAALADKSATTLQAANLAEKASELHFPIGDIDHQKLAVSMYREAVRIDPGYSGGYAGAAHSLATLALLASSEVSRDTFLTEARAYAEKAIDLDPLEGWSNSAVAWTTFVERDYERAVDLGRRAASLSETDGKTLDFHGLISLLTGNFEEAALASDPKRPRKYAGRHLAHLNLYGVANFHLGNFETAVASFDSAIEQGGPLSEFTFVFKAACYQASGDSITAAAMLEELRETWPEFRPDLALRRFYQDPKHAEEVIAQLEAIDRQMK